MRLSGDKKEIEYCMSPCYLKFIRNVLIYSKTESIYTMRIYSR
jgi:hypothetical protein